MYLLTFLKILVSVWILHSCIKVYGTCKKLGISFKFRKQEKEEVEVLEDE